MKCEGKKKDEKKIKTAKYFQKIFLLTTQDKKKNFSHISQQLPKKKRLIKHYQKSHAFIFF